MHGLMDMISWLFIKVTNSRRMEDNYCGHANYSTFDEVDVDTYIQCN